MGDPEKTIQNLHIEKYDNENGGSRIYFDDNTGRGYRSLVAVTYDLETREVIYNAIRDFYQNKNKEKQVEKGSVGTSLDDFLKEEGIYDDCLEIAKKNIAAQSTSSKKDVVNRLSAFVNETEDVAAEREIQEAMWAIDKFPPSAELTSILDLLSAAKVNISILHAQLTEQTLTQWAYDQACAALHKHEASEKVFREALEKIAKADRPSHSLMTAYAEVVAEARAALKRE